MLKYCMLVICLQLLRQKAFKVLFQYIFKIVLINIRSELIANFILRIISSIAINIKFLFSIYTVYPCHLNHAHFYTHYNTFFFHSDILIQGLNQGWCDCNVQATQWLNFQLGMKSKILFLFYPLCSTKSSWWKVFCC